MIDLTKQNAVDTSLPMDVRISYLRYCAAKYEVGTSPISDSEYDIEYYKVCEWLEDNDPDNEFLDEVGGEHVYGTKVKHDVIMGSLNKSLDVDQFKDWLGKTYPNHIATKHSFQFQHKIDGLSLTCLYEGGKLVKVLTRGDGDAGVDVTANALYVEGVRKTIAHMGKVEVRGEGYKDRQDFYKKWHTSVGGVYKNPRNFASGSMNQKDPKVTQERGLAFVAYEVVQKGFTTEREKMEFLEKNGFPALRSSTKWTKAGLTIDKLAICAQMYMDAIDRKNLPYDIDGVVFKIDEIQVGSKMGAVSRGRKPKSSRAIKFPSEESEPTPIIRVESCVGRTGRIVPKAHIKPVLLGGAEMTKATLHNYGDMLRKNITVGCEVIIAKKGDIIPQIIKVTKYVQGDIEVPTECPSCDGALRWTKSADGEKVDLVCDNFECIAQLNAKIENWLKKIGVKGIGKGTISKLTDQDQFEWEGKPIISSLPEMYYMLDNDRRSKHPFRKYAYLRANLGEKTYENIIKSIKKVHEIPLPVFIEALGIARIGSMAKDLVDIAPSTREISALTVSDIEALDGFGSVKAQNFVKGWKEAYPEVHLLKKYVNPIVVAPASNVLAGKKFCFTGSFSVPRKELEQQVIANGGKCGSVGKDTILVWDGGIMKGKYDKAVKLGCDIISEDDFSKLLED